MAQPGRTLVCSTDRKATSARRPTLHQGTGRRHPQLHPTPQSRPKTLRLAQNRRPNPRLRRTLLYTNFRLRTLGRISSLLLPLPVLFTQPKTNVISTGATDGLIVRCGSGEIPVFVFVLVVASGPGCALPSWGTNRFIRP